MVAGGRVFGWIRGKSILLSGIIGGISVAELAPKSADGKTLTAVVRTVANRSIAECQRSVHLIYCGVKVL